MSLDSSGRHEVLQSSRSENSSYTTDSLLGNCESSEIVKRPVIRVYKTTYN